MLFFSILNCIKSNYGLAFCLALLHCCRVILSDFINLTQVHNFTVSAQDIFTFRRLSVFTVSFQEFCNYLCR